MAENIIGLLMEIGADPSKAEAAMVELDAATVAESGKISSLWSGAMEAMTGPTGITLGAIVGLGTAMFEVAEKASEMGNRVYEAGEKTGLSASASSGLRALAQETGGSFDGLTTSFARATVNLANAADTGKGALTELFTTAELQSLRLKPVDEQMHVVLQRIYALNDVTERNRQLQALFGRGWQENTEVLKELADEGFDPAIEKAKQMGIYVDDNHARQAHEFDLAWNHLKGTLDGLSQTVGQSLVPAFTNLFNIIDGGTPQLEDLDAKVTQSETDMKKYGAAVALNGQIITKEQIEKSRQAKDAEEPWTAAVVDSVEAIRKQSAALKEGLPMWAQTLMIVDKVKKATEDAAKEGGAGASTAASIPSIFGTGPNPDWVKNLQQGAVAIGDMALRMGAPDSIQSIHLWEEMIERMSTIDALPLARQSQVIAQHTQQVQQGTSALQAWGKALDSDVAAQAAEATIKTSGLIAGRKAQAAVEAVWETARGIAALAEGTWPPNPAALASAGLHFEAAAQYAIMAGTSTHRHAGTPSSGTGGTVSPYGHAGSGAGSNVNNPQTLAPGAGGAGARFSGSGVIVVHGSADLHQ